MLYIFDQDARQVSDRRLDSVPFQPIIDFNRRRLSSVASATIISLEEITRFQEIHETGNSSSAVLLREIIYKPEIEAVVRIMNNYFILY